MESPGVQEHTEASRSEWEGKAMESIQDDSIIWELCAI